MMQNSFLNHDELLPFRDKWQITVNLLAKYLKVSSAIVMHVYKGEIEVFVASNSKGNPYKAKQKLGLGEGRYCETVIKTNQILNIPNALKDKKWKNNSGMDLNLISYLGLPILCADKKVFGTICVLDNKERHFNTEQIELLQQFKYLIEADINICQQSKKSAEKNITKISEKEESFQTLFEKNPISLWEEDFTEAIKHLNSLKNKGLTNVKKYLDDHPHFAQECAAKIKIVNINEASVKLHKAPNKNYLINNLHKTFSEQSFEVFKHELSAFAAGKTSFESEYEIRTLTGKTIHVILSIFPINPNEKSLTRAIVSLYDFTEKVKYTKKIEQINQQLIEERNIFTQGNVVVFKWAAEKDWPVEYVSQNVANVFGYTVEDFVSRKIKFADIIHPEDIQVTSSEIKNAQQKGLSQFEHKPYRIIHKNAKEVWLYDFTTVIRNSKGEITHYLGYIKDITKSKILEIEKDELFNAVAKQRNEFEALSEEYIVLNEDLEKRNIEIKASEERLSISTDTGKIGIWEWDLESKLAYWNQNMYTIHGMQNKGPMNYNNWLDYIHPNNKEKANRKINDLLLKEGSSFMELIIIRDNGTERNILASAKSLKNIHGKINKIIGAYVDITELKTAENELRNAKETAEINEENYRELFNNATDAIYIQDANGYFLDVNKGATKMYGYPKEYFIGKTPEFLSAPGKNDLQKVNEYVKLAFKGKPQQFDFWGMRKNGEIFPKIVRCQKGIYKGEEVVVTFSIDISERKRAEEELLQAKEKAEESDQLKTAFLNNLSHEIRTPMNSIIGFSQLLNRNNIDKEKRLKFVDRITNSSKQLLSIVEDIISISKIESNQIDIRTQELSVNNILTALYNFYQLKANEKNISLGFTKKLNPLNDLIKLDKQKLSQILNNLISNALKFTHEGSVSFGCEIVEKNHDFYLQFFVKDTGIGIDKSMHYEIFERFRQVEVSATREYGGLGLGLAISKGYIELMGGEFRLVSELNKGSEFYFTIPFKPVNTKPIITKETEIANSDVMNWSNKTILIAEDDNLNYILLIEILSYTGAKILHAKTGREAIFMCAGNKIDLILMDIKMPDLDGYQAIAAIKQYNSEIPIIAQTAYASLEDKQISKEIGCCAYISKPIDAEKLLLIINKFI